MSKKQESGTVPVRSAEENKADGLTADGELRHGHDEDDPIVEDAEAGKGSKATKADIKKQKVAKEKADAEIKAMPTRAELRAQQRAKELADRNVRVRAKVAYGKVKSEGRVYEQGEIGWFSAVDIEKMAGSLEPID
jgi:hypothetical protein